MTVEPGQHVDDLLRRQYLDLGRVGLRRRDGAGGIAPDDLKPQRPFKSAM